jgi:hypothetical protein
MPGTSRATCPHCGAQLAPLDIPEAFFAYAHDLACFNDQCPYFVRGFAWMEQQFGVRSSYRYRIDGLTGHPSPLAAYAPRAPSLGSLPEDAAGEAGEEGHP